MRRKLLLATRNPGKVREMRGKLMQTGMEVLSIDDLAGAPEVEEKYSTLEENAMEKARVLFRHTGIPTLADDTGLEVRVLGMKPGVHSARYAGSAADERANRRKLLEDMEGRKDRTARFRTVVAYVDGEVEQLFDGVCDGFIAFQECGDQGFGYDPVFVPGGGERTFAEMDLATKNRISHRGKALNRAAEYLKKKSNVGS